MSGHGGFSVIAGGNKPIPIELPKVGELAPGANKLGALNVEGGKNEPAVARPGEPHRRQAGYDAPQGGEVGREAG